MLVNKKYWINVIKEIAVDNKEFICKDNKNEIFYRKLLDKKKKGENWIESITVFAICKPIHIEYTFIFIK